MHNLLCATEKSGRQTVDTTGVSYRIGLDGRGSACRPPWKRRSKQSAKAVWKLRGLRRTYPSMSCQMFRAHASAYCASTSEGAGDSPPEPWTVSIVFFSAMYRWTDATWTTDLSSMKL